ncbi:hypothetical protein C3B59_10535 [Cryobacterium zongtaii]|uniref:Uncharacterized protein n=2 Tax=Cryobacterium zongtaii TaxID=1259217 RepID=A0A2S3ZCL5_9MICO|nr:hypothetical protein C3B59_10535 [Cryobacterium zongtaii]
MPWVSDAGKWSQSRKNALPGISDENAAIVEYWQPFAFSKRTGKPADSYAMVYMRNIDNAAKHRAPHLLEVVLRDAFIVPMHVAHLADSVPPVPTFPPVQRETAFHMPLSVPASFAPHLDLDFVISPVGGTEESVRMGAPGGLALDQFARLIGDLREEVDAITQAVV